MRTSLTARFVSHPVISFTAGRSAAWRVRLGLLRSSTVYHRPKTALVTVRALRSHTSGYRFAALAPLTRVRTRRSSRPTGCPRGRRA